MGLRRFRHDLAAEQQLIKERQHKCSWLNLETSLQKHLLFERNKFYGYHNLKLMDNTIFYPSGKVIQSIKLLITSFTTNIQGTLCTRMWSVLSDSLRPHGRQPTRFVCPWDSPGKKTGAGAIPFSKGSFQPRDGMCVTCIAGRLFSTEAPGKFQKTLEIIYYFHKSCVRGEMCKSNACLPYQRGIKYTCGDNPFVFVILQKNGKAMPIHLLNKNCGQSVCVSISTSIILPTIRNCFKNWQLDLLHLASFSSVDVPLRSVLICALRVQKL